jgi:hypothetical protein
MSTGNSNNQRNPMRIAHTYLDVRPARGVRLIERSGQIQAFPEPHRTPVLPTGWAPLTREQQDAVLHACDESPECLTFRVGSLWDAGTDYRVYCLTKEEWAGLWIASRYVADDQDDGGRSGDNRQLLGLGSDAVDAVRLALDFFNWDLQSHGESWRLSVEVPPLLDDDPRRV